MAAMAVTATVVAASASQTTHNHIGIEQTLAKVKVLNVFRVNVFGTQNDENFADLKRLRALSTTNIQHAFRHLICSIFLRFAIVSHSFLVHKQYK